MEKREFEVADRFTGEIKLKTSNERKARKAAKYFTKITGFRHLAFIV